MALSIDAGTVKALGELCQRHGIQRLAMFGSATRSDFDPKRSDIDLVADFAPERVPGLRFFGLHHEFEAVLDLRVDLVTRAMLSQRIRERAMADSVILYDAA